MQDWFPTSHWSPVPFRKYMYLLISNVGSDALKHAHMSLPDFTSFALGMDTPGCGGMNRLGGGKSSLAFCQCTEWRRKSKAGCLNLLSLIGMSAGGGFGGMDNLGNMGSFGGRMAGEFFIWKTINFVRRRPSQNKQNAPISLNVTLKLQPFNIYWVKAAEMTFWSWDDLTKFS